MAVEETSNISLKYGCEPPANFVCETHGRIDYAAPLVPLRAKVKNLDLASKELGDQVAGLEKKKADAKDFDTFELVEAELAHAMAQLTNKAEELKGVKALVARLEAQEKLGDAVFSHLMHNAATGEWRSAPVDLNKAKTASAPATKSAKKGGSS